MQLHLDLEITVKFVGVTRRYNNILYGGRNSRNMHAETVHTVFYKS
jgi:hypothetical protein